MTGAVSSDNDVFDAVVVYRTDPYGARIAKPATCRYGHPLTGSGSRIREAEGVRRVRCGVCAAAGVLNAYWTLRSTPPVANLAELDDGPYRRAVP